MTDIVEPHPEACNCIDSKAQGGSASTCHYCIQGEHEKCCANTRGGRRGRCPRAAAAEAERVSGG